MTYTYRGRQYVVINAGGHHMFSRGYGDYLLRLRPAPATGSDIAMKKAYRRYWRC